MSLTGGCFLLSSCFTQMTQVMGVGIQNESPHEIIVKHYLDNQPVETYLLAPNQLRTLLLYQEQADNQELLTHGTVEVTAAQACRITLTSTALRALATRAPHSHFWIIHITPEVFTSCTHQ
ncbi:MAG: hypothetical protein SVR94_00840 [Pseudomonadota bacterium]|nr:hypothetical protein [Pseudomonadota bacterium]